MVRPRPKPKDADVLEILNQYCTPKTTDDEEGEATSGGSRVSRVKPFNSLEEDLKLNPLYKDDYLDMLKKKFDLSARARDRRVREETVKVRHLKNI